MNEINNSWLSCISNYLKLKTASFFKSVAGSGHYYFMGIISCAFLCFLLLTACDTKPKRWVFEKEILLGEVRPIGISGSTDALWIADGDHNRVVRMDINGSVNKVIPDIERPMHLDFWKDELIIPSYGADSILVYEDNRLLSLAEVPPLNAPAGVDRFRDEMVICDFYGHNIHYYSGAEWITFGSEGHEQGQFYYPTDVQLDENYIYIADAYNHRVQVFDKAGGFIRTVGHDQGINAATGLLVTENQLFVTDFENSRLLIFDKQGKVVQVISERLNKPTDVYIHRGSLYVTNYQGKSMSVFQSKVN